MVKDASHSEVTLKAFEDSPAIEFMKVVYQHIEFPKKVSELKLYRRVRDELKIKKERLLAETISSHKAGDIDAYFALGCAYQYGGCVERDLEKARQLFQQATKAGHRDAMLKLALLTRRLNNNEDTEETVHWLKESATLGNADAMQSLAYRYRDGGLLEKDLLQAEFWFKAFYGNGNPVGAYYLGKFYEVHMENDVKAHHWYRIYAEQSPKNLRDLAWFLNREDTEFFDPAESLRLKIINVDHCIEMSRPVICGEIADHYLNGRGVEASKTEALKWLNKALALFKPDSKLAAETKSEIQELEDSLI